MKPIPYTNKIEDYLVVSEIIDYDKKEIKRLADQLWESSQNEIEYIKTVFEYVRDHIFHSADSNNDVITVTASQVLNAGHGICFAKAHLLAALLRCKSIPAGFCYQKLILDDETAPVLIYHGLNGVYLEAYKKWIRLDARGNKEGVNAQFGIETEQLAFPIRSEMGEEDNFIIYPQPDTKILEKLRRNKTRTELWNDLPTELAYQRKYIELESERLLFRRFTQEDFPIVYDWLSNLENMKYRSSEPKTEQEVHKYLDWAIQCAEQEECINFRYAVVLKETNELIGSCELAYTNKDPAELAWELHRNYWKKGYGTEIGRTLLKLGFEKLNLRRIIADCNTLNRGSYRIMELIGMRREAHYVKYYRGNSALNHQWCDKYLYAILREEYFSE